MNLAERLKAKSNETEATQESIRDEVLAYFKERFDAGDLENWLEGRISRSKDLQSKREYKVDAQFWSYHDGCSATNFRVGVIEWTNPESPNGYESQNYKGITLQNISDYIGRDLCDLTKDYLKELGFRITGFENVDSMYFHRRITIAW